MIDPEQLAICKQRGHEPMGHRDKWARCKHCGMWTRTISRIEESADEPPEEERDSMYQLERMVNKLKGKP
jgi:hypothetical protein